MTTMVDPLVAFARKHPEMFAADQRARMTRVLNTPGLEKADVVNQDLVKAEAKIARRKDVNPKRGIAEYGKVKFADPVNKKYPLDSEHIRAAWSYSHMPKNMAKYSDSEIRWIWKRIARAAKKEGITLEAAGA